VRANLSERRQGGVLVRRRKYGGGYLGRVSPSLRRALVGKAQCAADRFGLQMHVRVSLLSASAGERLLCSFHWRSVLSGACSVVPSAMRADGPARVPEPGLRLAPWTASSDARPSTGCPVSCAWCRTTVDSCRRVARPYNPARIQTEVPYNSGLSADAGHLVMR